MMPRDGGNKCELPVPELFYPPDPYVDLRKIFGSGSTALVAITGIQEKRRDRWNGQAKCVNILISERCVHYAESYPYINNHYDANLEQEIPYT